MANGDPGIILVCDGHGVVESVPREALGLGERATPGVSLVELVDAGSAGKASRFLEAVWNEGLALDWAMNVPVREELRQLHFLGVACDGGCVVAAGAPDALSERLLEGLPSLRDEQREAMREAMRRYTTLQKKQDRADDEVWAQILELNTELADKQRELVQKNAELDRRNAELEETQRLLQQERDRLRRANARLEELAAHDDLTGLYNRRAFDHHLKQEFRRARRHSTPLSLMLIDLDRFKEFNDAFGHTAGDEALRAAAEAIGETVDPTDLTARYGGEELAVILVNCPPSAAEPAAERCRLAIEAIDELDGPLTASIGVASFAAEMDDRAELVEAADEALYRAKDAGRNRVCRLDRPSRGSPSSDHPATGTASA